MCEDWTVDSDGYDVDRDIDATAKDTAYSEWTIKTLSGRDGSELLITI